MASEIHAAVTSSHRSRIDEHVTYLRIQAEVRPLTTGQSQHCKHALLLQTMAGSNNGLHVSQRFRVSNLTFQTQLLDLSGQGIASPTEQACGILASTRRMLQGDLDHDRLECGFGLVQ